MSEKKWCVYAHVNKTNGKRYIGITSKSNPQHRWNHGRGYKKRENAYFYNSIMKYGWDGFDHIILYSGLSESQAKSTEIRLIKEWKTQQKEYGYNLTAGGDGSTGAVVSEETRRKHSIASRKENLSDETLRRRSEGLRGRRLTEDHKRKIGAGNSKPIEMLDASGNVLRSFRSARDAEIELAINHSHISQCCNGTRKTTGGYKWRFTQ